MGGCNDTCKEHGGILAEIKNLWKVSDNHTNEFSDIRKGINKIYVGIILTLISVMLTGAVSTYIAFFKLGSNTDQRRLVAEIEKKSDAPKKHPLSKYLYLDSD